MNRAIYKGDYKTLNLNDQQEAVSTDIPRIRAGKLGGVVWYENKLSLIFTGGFDSEKQNPSKENSILFPFYFFCFEKNPRLTSPIPLVLFKVFYDAVWYFFWK